MMVTKFYCDVCEAEVDDGNELGSRMVLVLNEPDDVEDVEELNHICPDCTRKVVRILKGQRND